MNKLKVLILNDMVLFPNNELRIEYDNIYDREIINIIDNVDDELLFVNPINNDNYDVTDLPKIGVLAKLKLKLSVPNGKTRVVISGIERVEISDYEQFNNMFMANYKVINVYKKWGNILRNRNRNIKKVYYFFS